MKQLILSAFFVLCSILAIGQKKGYADFGFLATASDLKGVGGTIILGVNLASLISSVGGGVNYAKFHEMTKLWISYKGEQNEQKGWDETGKEIRGFVVEREARFKGGAESWKKFLEKNLNANVAAASGAAAGQYQVKVQFIVSKEGYLSNVKL